MYLNGGIGRQALLHPPDTFAEGKLVQLLMALNFLQVSYVSVVQIHMKAASVGLWSLYHHRPPPLAELFNHLWQLYK